MLTIDPLITQRGARDADVKNAKYNLDNCRIYAPFDAFVTNLTVSEGQYAHMGQQVFTLIDARTWWALANFREGQLRHVVPGTRADVYIASRPDRRFTGVVESAGFGVTPDPDVIGKLEPGLPDVQRTLDWVHLAARYPVRIRIENPPPTDAHWRNRGRYCSGTLTMAIAAIPAARSSRLGWLGDFLRQELAPYPGRGSLVTRMVLAATIVMVINMTFRIPYGAYGAIYALTISREHPSATLDAVRVILISFAVAVADVLISALLFAGDPLLRLVWVIGTLFIMFYSLSALSNYSAAARFGYLVVITIPLWDRHIPAELKVEDTLGAVGAISLASVITLVIEVFFARLKPWDDLSISIGERLEWVERLLRSRMEGLSDKTSGQQVIRLATLGTSRLRRDLLRSDYSPQYAEKMAAVVAFVGRLVDIAANLPHFPDEISSKEKNRLRRLYENIASIREDLLNRRLPHLAVPFEENPSAATPLLREIERTVSLIVEVFTGSAELGPFAPPAIPAKPRPMRIFAPDTFTNPEHIRFGLRGGLAASLCYITYNLIAWPGISTAITTCLLTALTIIGSSRQKQILRFGGALAGGAIGVAAQVFVLPALDSITGFLLLFVAVPSLPPGSRHPAPASPISESRSPSPSTSSTWRNSNSRPRLRWRGIASSASSSVFSSCG